MMTRISKKTLAWFPENVARIVEAKAARYNIKFFEFETKRSYQLHNVEGADVTLVYDNQSLSAQTVTNSTVGADINYDANGSATVPAGTWVVKVTYCYTKYWMDVIKVQ